MAQQNLAQALFAVILNANLVGVQGPRMTGDAAAMQKVFDSIDALQVAFDDWFAVQAGFKASAEDLVPVATAAELTQVATKKPVKKIVVATEADVPKPKVYGNVPTKGKDARGPLPPTRKRGRKDNVQDDPFDPKFYGKDQIPGPDPAAMELMERVSNEILGANEGE